MQKRKFRNKEEFEEELGSHEAHYVDDSDMIDGDKNNSSSSSSSSSSVSWF